jgi:hypothetical protein
MSEAVLINFSIAFLCPPKPWRRRIDYHTAVVNRQSANVKRQT